MKQRREMGRRRGKESKSYTLPSSPSHSSSSSDFEFTISISPRKSSTALCPADELFYKGQLLPLHLSERISMVRTLLLSSASTSSSTSTAARDSTGSSSNDSNSSFTSDLALFPDCDSSRPSDVTDDDDLKRLHNHNNNNNIINNNNNLSSSSSKKPHKYFSFSRFSSVFLPTKTRDPVKRMSVTAKEVIRKYFKKVKPLYEKLSQRTVELTKTERSTKQTEKRGTKESAASLSHSFSGNLRYPRRRRRRSCVSSCPSSMRSSPNHSGVLSQRCPTVTASIYSGDTSSMEELQSAIQGAIAHCKNSLIQNKTMLSNEI
ncbi:putative membrane-associated kinase regulator 1, partial [Mucuna pruriens]